ncbi:uncharacterized protein JCM10292_000919 [Rhodotorula paludigena]|uniref:uncharacterized protein n=1 Tax=Rhodotorula paludigena TaxID=86838 RepID=UPI00317469D7
MTAPFSAAVSSACLRFGTLLALLVLFFGAVRAQETTLTREADGVVVTTSIQPTLYTGDDGVVGTFTPTAPQTITPTAFSSGSIMKAADYISTTSVAEKQKGLSRRGNSDLSSGAPSQGSPRNAAAALLVSACIGAGASVVV